MARVGGGGGEDERGICFTSIWEASVPAGSLQLHKYPDIGLLSCQALSKGCLEERSPVAQYWLPGSLGLYTEGLLFFTMRTDF